MCVWELLKRNRRSLRKVGSIKGNNETRIAFRANPLERMSFQSLSAPQPGVGVPFPFAFGGAKPRQETPMALDLQKSANASVAATFC